MKAIKKFIILKEEQVVVVNIVAIKQNLNNNQFIIMEKLK